MKKILILGCGWVGEELALHLLSKGFSVYASTTSSEKAKRLNTLGISAFEHNFDTNERFNEVLLHPFDYVLTSVPAASRLTVDQVQRRFEHVSDLLKSIQFAKHIFLSSIGVYPDKNGVFTEDSVVEQGQNLVIAESYMLKIQRTHVYRLGGLFGKNRVFAKYFENRICRTGNQLANFVHLDDVIDLIHGGLESDLESNIYNIVSPEHPIKKAVVLASAQKYGFDLPSTWEPKDSFQKFVDGSKVIAELSYIFKYPSPMGF